MAKPTPLNWLFLTCLGIIWGASFMGTKLALTDFQPMTIAALRLSIGAIILLSVVFFGGYKFPTFKTRSNRLVWLCIFGMGFFTNALPFSLLNWGQLYVTSGFAGISMSVVPLLVLPLAHFLLPDDKMSGRKIFGFLIGFVGVLILIGPHTLFASSGETLEPLARLACIGAASCYAIGSMITRLCPPVSNTAFAALGLAVGACLMVPTALWFEGPPPMPGTTALIGIIYLGLFPTAIATILLVSVIKSAGPAFLSLVNYQVPVWAVVFGVLVLNEALPGQFALALGLILLGLCISQWRNLKKL